MTAAEFRRISKGAVLAAAVLCPGCSRAPTFDILGSFFPAWLLCLVCGIILTSLAYGLLQRIRVPLAIPVLAYPSLTALFTLALWLVFFR